MPLKIKFSEIAGQFAEALDAHEETIKIAATEAIRQVGQIAKDNARASIGSAGFSLKWQNAMRVDIYPRRGASLGAAAVIYHKIPYAGIFEEGGNISGQPYLWIPLPTIPRKLGGSVMTAELYVQRIGPLFKLNRPGRPPLLLARVNTSDAQRHAALGRVRGSLGKFAHDIGSLRRGARNGNASIPAFVGVSLVKIQKKFRVTEAVENAAARLEDFYARNLGR